MSGRRRARFMLASANFLTISGLRHCSPRVLKASARNYGSALRAAERAYCTLPSMTLTRLWGGTGHCLMLQTLSKKKSAETSKHVCYDVSSRKNLILSPKETIHPARRLHLRTSWNWTTHLQSLDMTRSAFCALMCLPASCSTHVVTCACALNVAPRFINRQQDSLKSEAIRGARGKNFSTEQSNVPSVAPTPKRYMRALFRDRCITASSSELGSSIVELVRLASL